jgi:hypothetical protein
MHIFRERKDTNILFDINTIIDIEKELLNDSSLTKEDYLQYITRKITRTSNPSEKSRLISQKKKLQNIEIFSFVTTQGALFLSSIKVAFMPLAKPLLNINLNMLHQQYHL